MAARRKARSARAMKARLFFFGAVHGLKNVLTKFISCVSEEASNFAGSERLSHTVQRVAKGR